MSCKPIKFLELNNTNLPDFVVIQYQQIKELVDQEQYYAALCKCKDFLEVFFKYPDAICLKKICEYLLSCEVEEKLTDEELGNVRLILERIIGKLSATGDFIDVARLLTRLENSPIFKGDIYPKVFVQLKKIKKALDQVEKDLNSRRKNNPNVFTSFAEWRNRKLGHGALNLDKEAQQKDILAIVDVINAFLKEAGATDETDTLRFYEGLIYSYGALNPLDGIADSRLKGRKEREVRLSTVAASQFPVSLSPFILALEGLASGVERQTLILERYDSHKDCAHVIDYANGCFYLEKRLTTALLSVKKCLNFQPGSDNSLGSDSISREDDEILAKQMLEAKHLVKNNAFSKPIRNMLLKNKGIIWLEAERGMGKSIFALQTDKTTLPTEVFKYRINSYYNARWDAFVTQFVQYVHIMLNNIKVSDSYFFAELKFQQAFRELQTLKSRQEAFQVYLKEVRDKLQESNRSLLILIDGVDELPETGDVINPNIFLDYASLPEGIYIVLLSRPFASFASEEINHGAQAVEYKEINHTCEDNQNAINAYFKSIGLVPNKLIKMSGLDEQENSELLEYLDTLKNEIKKRAGYRFVYIAALTTFFKMRIFSTTYTDVVGLNKVLKENLALLKTFPGYEAEADQVLAKGKGKGAESFKSAFIKAFYVEYAKLSKQYAEELLKALVIIAICPEWVTLEELSYLLNRTSSPTFKMLGLISTLSPFISIERSEYGNLLVMNQAWKETFCSFKYQDRCFAEEVKTELEQWAKFTVGYEQVEETASRKAEEIVHRPPIALRIKRIDSQNNTEKLEMATSYAEHCDDNHTFSREESLLIERFYPFKQIATVQELEAVYRKISLFNADIGDLVLLRRNLSIQEKLLALQNLFSDDEYVEKRKSYDNLKDIYLTLSLLQGKAEGLKDDERFLGNSIVDIKSQAYSSLSEGKYEVGITYFRKAIEQLLVKNDITNLESLFEKHRQCKQDDLRSIADLLRQIGIAKYQGGIDDFPQKDFLNSLILLQAAENVLVATITDWRQEGNKSAVEACQLELVEVYSSIADIYLNLMELENPDSLHYPETITEWYKKLVLNLKRIPLNYPESEELVTLIENILERTITVLEEAGLEETIIEFCEIIDNITKSSSESSEGNSKYIESILCWHTAMANIKLCRYENSLDKIMSWFQLSEELLKDNADKVDMELFENDLQMAIDMAIDSYVAIGKDRYWIKNKSGLSYIIYLLRQHTVKIYRYQVFRRDIVSKYFELETQLYTDESVLGKELHSLLRLLEQCFETSQEELPAYFVNIYYQCLAKIFLLEGSVGLLEDQEELLVDTANYFKLCPEYIRINVLAAILKNAQGWKTLARHLEVYCKVHGIQTPWKIYELQTSLQAYIDAKKYLKGGFLPA